MIARLALALGLGESYVESLAATKVRQNSYVSGITSTNFV
jgi:hypothetical protein